MSANSLASILAWLNGHSRTLGWGAIVTYNRSQANQLLFHEYTDKLGQEQALEPVSGEISLGGVANEVLMLRDLQLGYPVLSFDAARPGQATATLTLDIFDGLIMSDIQFAGTARRLSRIHYALPVNAPRLSMKLDLMKTPGSVDRRGDVVLDLKEARDFECSFNDNPEMAPKLAEFFRTLFAQVPAERRRFVLSSIGKQSFPGLTPEAFELRTLAAPGATLLGASNYGDGAVQAYIRFQGGGQDCDFPGVGYKYLIPDDNQGSDYSASVLISSKVVVQDLLMPALVQRLGNGIGYSAVHNSKERPWALAANAGGIDYRTFRFTYTERRGFECELTSSSIAFPFAGTHKAEVSDGMLSITWRSGVRADFHRKMNIPGWPDNHDDGELSLNQDFDLRLKPALTTPYGRVDFIRDNSSRRGLSLAGISWLIEFTAQHKSDCEAYLVQRLNGYYFDRFNDFTLANIDAFAAANLLFNGSGVEFSQVAMPGDLALFGRLAPSRLGCHIIHENRFERPGAVLYLITEPVLSNPRWSIRSVDGQPPGEIVASAGRYTTPWPQQFSCVQVIVTVTGTLENTSVTTSTLITVVREPLGVSPQFQFCSASGTVSVEANPKSGTNLLARVVATDNPGSLVADSARPARWIYTPPQLSGNQYQLDEIKVSGQGYEQRVRVLAMRSSPAIEVRRVGHQLTAYFGDQAYPANEIQWWCAGRGTVDANGVYRWPQEPDEFGYDLIIASEKGGMPWARSGYEVVLWKDYLQPPSDLETPSHFSITDQGGFSAKLSWRMPSLMMADEMWELYRDGERVGERFWASFNLLTRTRSIVRVLPAGEHEYKVRGIRTHGTAPSTEFSLPIRFAPAP